VDGRSHYYFQGKVDSQISHVHFAAFAFSSSVISRSVSMEMVCDVSEIAGLNLLGLT
jgi:hypothetical protein